MFVQTICHDCTIHNVTADNNFKWFDLHSDQLRYDMSLAQEHHLGHQQVN